MTTPPSPATADVRKDNLRRLLTRVRLGSIDAEVEILELFTALRAPQPLGTLTREGWNEAIEAVLALDKDDEYKGTKYICADEIKKLALHPLPGKDEMPDTSVDDLDPADVWDDYCEETPPEFRSPQGALAFGFSAALQSSQPKPDVAEG